ncbi:MULTISPECIES: S24 family peptidase [unclassified Bradyrhizobium]
MAGRLPVSRGVSLSFQAARVFRSQARQQVERDIGNSFQRRGSYGALPVRWRNRIPRFHGASMTSGDPDSLSEGRGAPEGVDDRRKALHAKSLHEVAITVNTACSEFNATLCSMGREEKLRQEQGARLKAARRAAGYRSAAAAASENGWPESTYRAHEGGSRTIGQDDAERYAARFRALGASVTGQQILYGAGEMPPQPAAEAERDRRAARPLPVDPIRQLGAYTLPVLGVSLGGRDDDRGPDFWMNGETVAHVARPRKLEGRRNAFGLYVDGSSMEPRYFAGDLIVVEKVPPAPGDDVVVELKGPRGEDDADNPSFLKRLVARRGGFITVEQFNPPKRLDFDLKEIKNLFRVIPLKELMG